MSYYFIKMIINLYENVDNIKMIINLYENVDKIKK